MAQVDTPTRAEGVAEIESPPAGGPPTAARATGQPAGISQGFTVYDSMLLGMVIVWAANPAAIKWALDYMHPLAFNAIRFALATILPVGLLLMSRETLRWHKGDGWKLLGLGLIGHGLYQTFFILGISMTLAGNVALILSINPAFVAVFGALFGFERIRSHTWLGVSITLVGVGLVVFGTGKPLELGSKLLGDLIILGVTMMWALYTVLSQVFLKRYSAVKLNAMTMPFGALFLLVVATPSFVETAPSWPTVPPAAWLILVGSGLLAVSLTYIIWYKGVQKLGATRTAVYSNLVPVLAAIISFFLLKEPLGWAFWAGMLLVIAGVTLARFGGRFKVGIRG